MQNEITIFVVVAIVVAIVGGRLVWLDSKRKAKEANQREHERAAAEMERRRQIELSKKLKKERSAKLAKEAVARKNAAIASAINLCKIDQFTVRNGKGPNRGTVSVEIDWSGPEDTELVVYRGYPNTELYSDRNAVRSGYRTRRIGQEWGGKSFSLIDVDVDEKSNYHFYAWIEGKVEYTEQRYTSSKGRAANDEVETLTRSASYTSCFETRSVAVRFGETQEQFLERKRRQLAAQHALDEQRHAQGKGNSGELTIDEIVEQVLAEVTSEQEIMKRLKEKITALDLDDELAEAIQTEVIARFYDQREE